MSDRPVCDYCGETYIAAKAGCVVYPRSGGKQAHWNIGHQDCEDEVMEKLREIFDDEEYVEDDGE